MTGRKRDWLGWACSWGCREPRHGPAGPECAPHRNSDEISRFGSKCKVTAWRDGEPLAKRDPPDGAGPSRISAIVL